jgi:hypothetical protein
MASWAFGCAGLASHMTVYPVDVHSPAAKSAKPAKPAKTAWAPGLSVPPLPPPRERAQGWMISCTPAPSAPFAIVRYGMHCDRNQHSTFDVKIFQEPNPLCRGPCSAQMAMPPFSICMAPTTYAVLLSHCRPLRNCGQG